MYPNIKVFIKPISTTMDTNVHHLKVDYSSTKPTIIDNQFKQPKIGAFEVQLYAKKSMG
jgi:hypothetical protein